MLQIKVRNVLTRPNLSHMSYKHDDIIVDDEVHVPTSFISIWSREKGHHHSIVFLIFRVSASYTAKGFGIFYSLSDATLLGNVIVGG